MSTRLKMTISLPLIISSFIGLVAAVVAVISFTPTYLAGVDGVDNAVTTLRGTMIDKATLGIENFFSMPLVTMGTVADTYHSSALDLAHLSDSQKLKFMCDLALKDNGILGASWYEPFVPLVGDLWFFTCDMRFGTPLAMQINRSTNDVDIGNIYGYNPATNSLSSGFSAGKTSVNRTAVGVADDFEVFNIVQTTQKAIWSPPWMGYDSVQFSLNMGFHDQNNNPAMIGVEILPKATAKLLSQLGLSKSSRAVLVDRTSGWAMGTSWGGAVQTLLAQATNLSAPASERMIVHHVKDLNDTTIVDAWKHLGGDEGVRQLPKKHNTTMGKGSDKVFLDINTISDPYGLSLILLIAMPEKDFMEEVHAARTTTIIVVVVCFLVVIGLSVLFSIAIIKPIERVGVRMYKTASLQDDDEEDPRSILTEVRDMQDAYNTMKIELNRMKSYLPQSVLCAMYGNDDDEDASEFEEGDVSITDMSASASGVSGNANASGCSMGASGRSRRSKSQGNDSTPSQRSSIPKSVAAHSAGAHAGLNTSKSLAMKRVVVVVFNLMDFHRTANAHTVTNNKVTNIQTPFLNIVNKHVRDNKGVVDSFQGDHIIATFNAINTVHSAGKRASNAALHVIQEAKENPLIPRISVGIAGAPALVGNMGNNELQRFNVVGRVYMNAQALERLAARRLRSETHKDHLILASDSVVGDINLEMLYQSCDYVQLPGSNPENGGTVVVEIVSLKKMKTEEWMYQLEEGENADPFVAINDAYGSLAAGDVKVAAEALASHQGVVKKRRQSDVSVSSNSGEGTFHKMSSIVEETDIGGQRLEAILAAASATGTIIPAPMMY